MEENEERCLKCGKQEALTRLLVEKGIFTKEEFLEMARVVNIEIESAKNLPKLT
jgi:hypothetical protein